MTSSPIDSSARKVVTIDGLAGTGKTAVSRELAKRLNFCYLSSGLLYRAIGLIALRAQKSPEEIMEILPLLKNSKIELRARDQVNNQLFLDGIDVTTEVLMPEVSAAASALAVFPEIRTYLLDLQRNAFPGQPIVAEGRDMGTVVFPDAPVKIFLTCPAEVMAERRLEQMIKNLPFKGAAEIAELKNKLKMEIEDRNSRDLSRELSPTVPASEALVVENSGQSLTQVVDFVYDYATQILR